MRAVACPLCFFVCWKKKNGVHVGSRKTCACAPWIWPQKKEKTSYKLRAFCSPFTLTFFLFCVFPKIKLEDLILKSKSFGRFAAFRKVPFVAAHQFAHVNSKIFFCVFWWKHLGPENFSIRSALASVRYLLNDLVV